MLRVLFKKGINMLIKFVQIRFVSSNGLGPNWHNFLLLLRAIFWPIPCSFFRHYPSVISFALGFFKTTPPQIVKNFKNHNITELRTHKRLQNRINDQLLRPHHK